MDAQQYSIFRNQDLSNSSEDQLAPVPYAHNGDTGIVFMSNKIIPRPQLEKVMRPDGSTADPMNIYFYDQTGKKGIKNQRLFEIGSNSEAKGDIGPVTFSGDYTKLCFVQPQRNAAGDTDTSGFGGLFFSYWVDGTWSEPEPFEHNDPGINYNMPCLSKDGQLLFFAAEGDLEGAQGGMDIYYSMEMNGSWSEPVNLGDRINTPEHEIFPYYFQSEGALNTDLRLYFSSKGHNARGETFDLFYATFYEGEWMEPVPVPSLNSARFDELGIFVNEQLTEGMFSRRAGDQFNIYDFRSTSTDQESFTNVEPMKEAHLCYRIYDRKIDTVDPVVFEYEWIIKVFNDTLGRLPGHEVKYCFPGPGNYLMSFKVTNKLTDTTYIAANITLEILEYEQPFITADKDTVVKGEPVNLSAAASNLPEGWDRVEYIWTFPDTPQQKKGEVVEHSFSVPGKRPVILGAKKVLSRSEEKLLRENKLKESDYKLAVYKDIIVLPE